MSHSYEDIISLENLCLAWREFIIGKKSKPDVQIFARDLMDNIISLHLDLTSRSYRHGGYESFFINDPKRRHIHKASVRDRLLHHAVYRILYPFFDRTFIAGSFSCRDDKGMHKAINRFRAMSFEVSKNHTKTCWVLKCDIKKFFASIDHDILLGILGEYIPDKDIMRLLENIIESFETARPHPALSSKGEGTFASEPPATATPPCPLLERGGGVRFSPFPRGNAKGFAVLGGRQTTPKPLLGKEGRRIGLPLDNLTSQLFANVYLNVFDQWVKHRLKAKYYIRYADDFVFFSRDKFYLANMIPEVKDFLNEKLNLTLHPGKIFLRAIASGVDFLGWVNFTDHRVLRTKTKQRMLRNIRLSPREATIQSYLGLLRHGNTQKLQKEALGEYWLWREK